MANKNAKIVFIEKGKKGVVVCPHCQTKQNIKCVSMGKKFITECASCKEEMIVDFPKLMKSIHWL